MRINDPSKNTGSYQGMGYKQTVFFNPVARILRIAGLSLIVLVGAGAMLARAQSGGGQAVIVPPASSGSGTLIQGQPSVGNIPVGTGSAFAAQAKPVFDVRDYTNLAATISAASTAGGGTVLVASGRYSVSAQTIPSNVTLQGMGRAATVLYCNGATDGLVISGTNASGIWIHDLTLEADSASCGKAINFSNASAGAGPADISNVEITQAGSGFWTYGLWSTFLEVANISQMHIYQSAATAVHMENASNQVRFYGLDIVGASSTNAAYLRGIELVASGPEVYGGTVQGYWTDSAINISGTLTVQPILSGVDVEDSNTTSTDGAIIVINGSSNVTLSHITGVPSVTVTGTVRGCNINGGILGAVTFGASVVNCMVESARAVSITDNGGQNGWMNTMSNSGSAYSTKIPLAQMDQIGTTSPVSATNPGANTLFTMSNGGCIYALESGGTADCILWPFSGANNTYIQYKAGQSLNIRNAGGTSNATLTDTGDSFNYEVKGTFLDGRNGTAQTAANIALGTGWGTGAAVSAVSGFDQVEQFTITAGSSGVAASPTITVTFPATAPASQICTLAQSGGSASLPNASTGAVTTASAPFTVSGTPTASATYTYVMRCGL
jgi:hypothetical protein